MNYAPCAKTCHFFQLRLNIGCAYQILIWCTCPFLRCIIDPGLRGGRLFLLSLEYELSLSLRFSLILRLCDGPA